MAADWEVSEASYVAPEQGSSQRERLRRQLVRGGADADAIEAQSCLWAEFERLKRKDLERRRGSGGDNGVRDMLAEVRKARDERTAAVVAVALPLEAAESERQPATPIFRRARCNSSAGSPPSQLQSSPMPEKIVFSSTSAGGRLRSPSPQSLAYGGSCRSGASKPVRCHECGAARRAQIMQQGNVATPVVNWAASLRCSSCSTCAAANAAAALAATPLKTEAAASIEEAVSGGGVWAAAAGQRNGAVSGESTDVPDHRSDEEEQTEAGSESQPVCIAEPAKEVDETSGVDYWAEFQRRKEEDRRRRKQPGLSAREILASVQSARRSSCANTPLDTDREQPVGSHATPSPGAQADTDVASDCRQSWGEACRQLRVPLQRQRPKAIGGVPPMRSAETGGSSPSKPKIIRGGKKALQLEGEFDRAIGSAQPGRSSRDFQVGVASLAGSSSTSASSSRTPDASPGHLGSQQKSLRASAPFTAASYGNGEVCAGGNHCVAPTNATDAAADGRQGAPLAECAVCCQPQGDMTHVAVASARAQGSALSCGAAGCAEKTAVGRPGLRSAGQCLCGVGQASHLREDALRNALDDQSMYARGASRGGQTHSHALSSGGGCSVCLQSGGGQGVCRAGGCRTGTCDASMLGPGGCANRAQVGTGLLGAKAIVRGMDSADASSPSSTGQGQPSRARKHAFWPQLSASQAVSAAAAVSGLRSGSEGSVLQQTPGRSGFSGHQPVTESTGQADSARNQSFPASAELSATPPGSSVEAAGSGLELPLAYSSGAKPSTAKAHVQTGHAVAGFKSRSSRHLSTSNGAELSAAVANVQTSCAAEGAEGCASSHSSTSTGQTAPLTTAAGSDNAAGLGTSVSERSSYLAVPQDTPQFQGSVGEAAAFDAADMRSCTLTASGFAVSADGRGEQMLHASLPTGLHVAHGASGVEGYVLARHGDSGVGGDVVATHIGIGAGSFSSVPSSTQHAGGAPEKVGAAPQAVKRSGEYPGNHLGTCADGAQMPVALSPDGHESPLLGGRQVGTSAHTLSASSHQVDDVLAKTSTQTEGVHIMAYAGAHGTERLAASRSSTLAGERQSAASPCWRVSSDGLSMDSSTGGEGGACSRRGSFDPPLSDSQYLADAGAFGPAQVVEDIADVGAPAHALANSCSLGVKSAQPTAAVGLAEDVVSLRCSSSGGGGSGGFSTGAQHGSHDYAPDRSSENTAGGPPRSGSFSAGAQHGSHGYAHDRSSEQTSGGPRRAGGFSTENIWRSLSRRRLLNGRSAWFT
eukprot:TRINITY_DN2121_c0_g1_i5.p1 TRINITY_DN2121_c0_g1~~TRINITY_DN2121_c0_g1_i5.p1  ORF type:complete len:1269 (+),score=160.12 TRINITY_DN2121_c0_g1_i5:96-3902(+)